AFFQKRLAADAADFGGFGDVIARGLESLRDGLAFGRFERAKTGESRGAAGSSANVVWKIFWLKFRDFREDNGTLESVAEFAEVSWPGVCRDDATSGFGKLHCVPIVNRRESDHEMLSDGNDVGAAIAQWRYHDRENAQAEEKIFTKMARGDSGLEIGVGKSDQAGLNTKSFGPAGTLEGG